MRTRRTPGYRHIDRDHIGHAAATGVALTEDSTRATAVADRNDELRVWRGIVGAPQRHLHIFGNGSRNQQQICVPRTCYKPDTLAFDIVEWIIERVDLQLAAVAGSGINGSNAQRAAEYF